MPWRSASTGPASRYTLVASGDPLPPRRGRPRPRSARLRRARHRGELAAGPRLRHLHGRRHHPRRASRDLAALVHGAGAGRPRQLARHHPSVVAARHLRARRRGRPAQRRRRPALLAVGRRCGVQRRRRRRPGAEWLGALRARPRHRPGARAGLRRRPDVPAVADAPERPERSPRAHVPRDAAADPAGRPARLRPRTRPPVAGRARRRAARRAAAERQPVHLRGTRHRPPRRADLVGRAGRRASAAPAADGPRRRAVAGDVRASARHDRARHAR